MKQMKMSTVIFKQPNSNSNKSKYREVGMKRIKRKIKELMSRPGKNLKKMRKTISNLAESSLQKKTASPFRRKSDFSLEEEAAQLAYRHGWDIPTYQSYLVSGQEGTHIEEDIIPEPSEDREKIVRERDPMIERLEKKISMAEEGGWEAIYT
jgi:hypothetical protein